MKEFCEEKTKLKLLHDEALANHFMVRKMHARSQERDMYELRIHLHSIQSIHLTTCITINFTKR